MIYWDILLTLIGLFFLWKGADNLVDTSAKIAYTLGFSPLLIGLTVVAFGTSAPEFVVTISAAFKGQSNVSVSNVIGSNIFNLGFILGGVALIRGVKTGPKLVYRDGLLLLSITIAIFIFLLDLKLSFIEALILFSSLIVYLISLFIKKEKIEEVDLKLEKATYKDYLKLVVSLLVVIGGGHFLVEGAVGIAKFLGVSDWVIGVTIVAAGTSAPEFATSLAAALKGQHEISAGNLIGSDIFNLSGVLGLAGMLGPLKVSEAAFGSTLMLVGMVFLVLILMRTGWKLSRMEGAFLISLNIIRWAKDFLT